MDLTPKNVAEVNFEEMSEYCYSLIKQHVDYRSMDKEQFVHLLGYYPAMYQFLSELYTTMIGKVRTATELKQTFLKQQYMDKRDVLEQVLKVCKFQYDSLSRKITIFTSEGE